MLGHPSRSSIPPSQGWEHHGRAKGLPGYSVLATTSQRDFQAGGQGLGVSQGVTRHWGVPPHRHPIRDARPSCGHGAGLGWAKGVCSVPPAITSLLTPTTALGMLQQRALGHGWRGRSHGGSLGTSRSPRTHGAAGAAGRGSAASPFAASGSFSFSHPALGSFELLPLPSSPSSAFPSPIPAFLPAAAPAR